MEPKKDAEPKVFVCPVGKFFLDLEKCVDRRSKFQEHLALSRIEFFKAIRSLVDDRIESLEKKRTQPCERVTKIEVE
jgi:hypothetical protein